MKRLGLLTLLGLGLIAAPAAAFASGPGGHRGHGGHGGHGHVRVQPRHYNAPAARHYYARPYVAPQVRVVHRPHAAAAVWIPGYWTHYGAARTWVAGTWGTPPYAGWHWVAPHWAWNGYSWVWESGRWVPG